MPDERERPRRSREVGALAITIVIVAIILAAFLYLPADFGTAPDKPPPKESAETRAPEQTEPPAPNVTPPR
jgi:hypothetical protein